MANDPAAPVADPRTQFFTLADGRQLSFLRCGDLTGKPCFYFHGFPGSRLEAELYAQEARNHGLQLVAVDRPGYGQSSPQAQQALLTWPEDIRQLADHLGWQHFGLIGISGAGPFICACAYTLRNRVVRSLLISALGPTDHPGALTGMAAYNRLLLALGRHLPIAGLGVLQGVALAARRRPDWLIQAMARFTTCPNDRETLADKTLSQGLARSLAEAFTQGPKGTYLDGMRYAKPWGFSPQQIDTPVDLWHGTADPIVPVGMGRYLAQHLPRCNSHFIDHEGHFSLVVRHGPALMETYAKNLDLAPHSS